MLRIEDTDAERSREDKAVAIIEGLRWLGLDWDGPVIYQSAHRERHKELAADLLRRGEAYRCFCTPEELDQMRASAQSKGEQPRYDGRWRDRDPSEAAAGSAYTIRFKAPREGTTLVSDSIMGEVRFPNGDLDDFVILRSDGLPTYNLAVVVDDHDSAVTDVVRGVDHLTNAARQKQLYEALGWTVPRFAHLPLIHASDGTKLSKRHGVPGIERFRDLGYFPDVLLGALVRLGWSHGDQERFRLEEMVQLFSLDRVGRSASRFDLAKLDRANGLALRGLDGDELFSRLLSSWSGFDPTLVGPYPREEGHRLSLRSALPELALRSRHLQDIAARARFLWTCEPPASSGEAVQDLDADEVESLALIGASLSGLAAWERDELETVIKDWVAKRGVSFRSLASPMRLALTGSRESIGLYSLLIVLGREESLARLGRYVKGVGSSLG